MIIKIHPKRKKIEIELPDEYVDKELKIEIKPKSDLNKLAGSLKVPKEKINYELEKKAWELAVLEKYGAKNGKN
jgi:hypothetical protein